MISTTDQNFNFKQFYKSLFINKKKENNYLNQQPITNSKVYG